MAEQTLTMEYLATLLTASQVAELKECTPATVRREHKKGNIPGAIEALGRVGFDPDAIDSWTPPEGGTRVAVARDDGRRKYWIWLNDSEAAAVKTQGYELEDPREVRKARRAARKASGGSKPEAVETAEEPAGEDLFANFDA